MMRKPPLSKYLRRAAASFAVRDVGLRRAREGESVTAASGQSLTVPVTQKREFWVLLAYAVVLGVVGAFAALIFVGAITLGDPRVESPR